MVRAEVNGETGVPRMELQQVPDIYRPDLDDYLERFPYKNLRRIENLEIKVPKDYPDPLSALMLLTGVDNKDDIGKNGPSIASRATKDNEDNPELRLFEIGFGRDMDVVVGFVGDHFPELYRGTTRWQAERQALSLSENPKSRAANGNHVHEDRPATDELAKRLMEENGWQFPYFGSTDVNPRFVQVFAKTVEHFGLEFLDEVYESKYDGNEYTMQFALNQTIRWIKSQMDRPGNYEGLLESYRSGAITHGNHGWMDSPDAAFHADGRLANDKSGTSSLEVQVLTYDALIDAAKLYERKSLRLTSPEQENERLYYQEEAIDLRQRAAKLRGVILDKFWIEDEDGGYFASGSDRDPYTGKLRVFKVRRSNMGHLLNSRMLDGDDPEIVDKREKVIRTLFSEEMLAASGIRTLSNKEVRYYEAGYHNGNVWLWDTYYTAKGLDRHGYHRLANELKERIKHTVEKYKKYPEFAMGGNHSEPLLNDRIVDLDDPDNMPAGRSRLEQPPQEIQAWTVAAIVDMLLREESQTGDILGPFDPKKHAFEEEVYPLLQKTA